MIWSEFVAAWIADCRIWGKLQHEWREKILERDGYMCQFCGTVERLEFAHIAGLSASSIRHPSPEVFPEKKFCPRCESEFLDERKIKQPKYRCKRCGAEFDRPMSKSEAWNKAKKMVDRYMIGREKELKQYFDDDNLITLCISCHHTLDTPLRHAPKDSMKVKKFVREWLKDRHGSHYRKVLREIYEEGWHRNRL